MARKRRNSTALENMQNDGGYSKKAYEVLDFTYYDTIKLVSTVLTHNFFTVPLGAAGKTLADTNLVTARVLPQGQNLKVHNLKMFYIAKEVRVETELLAIYQVLKNTTISIEIPGKENLGQWPISEIFGVASLIQVTPAVAGDYCSQIQPSYKAIFPLNYAIKIGAVQTFSVKLQHHVAPAAGLDGDSIMLGFNGRLKRMS